jgi:hypothetical protein
LEQVGPLFNSGQVKSDNRASNRGLFSSFETNSCQCIAILDKKSAKEVKKQNFKLPGPVSDALRRFSLFQLFPSELKKEMLSGESILACIEPTFHTVSGNLEQGQVTEGSLWLSNYRLWFHPQGVWALVLWSSTRLEKSPFHVKALVFFMSDREALSDIISVDITFRIVLLLGISA